MTWARVVARASPGGFWKLALAGPLLAHRGGARAELVHLARIGALQVEDCGPCVRTQLGGARRDGVEPALLRAALAGGARLGPLTGAAYRLGVTVANGGVFEDEDRALLEREVGRAGVVDLTLAAAAVRLFPALKRGLGYAQSCAAVRLEV